MKTRLIIAFAALLLHLGLQAQITCTPNNAVTGQALTVSILGTGTNLNSLTATYINVSGMNLNANMWTASSATSMSANFTIPPWYPTGTGFLRVNQANTQFFTCPFTVSAGAPVGNYGQVAGKLYQDVNGNCAYNLGEVVYTNRTVTFQPGNFTAMTDANGNYSIWLPIGSYTARFFGLNNGVVTCPVGGVRTVNLTFNGQVLTGQDFATGSATVYDAESMTTGAFMRPGFNAVVYGWARNAGNTIIPAATMKVLKPTFANFVAAYPSGYTISGDTVIWTLSNLPIGGSTMCYMNLYVPNTVTLGTPYHLYSRITASPPDAYPANDTMYWPGTASGAFDPNDKQVVSGQGRIADGDLPMQDSVLNYLIRFQNTGTDTAFNIYVRDTLDVANLEMGSLRITGASHPYTVSMSSGGQMQLTFTNILLPDSNTNEAASHGWIAYRIHRKSTVTLGTVIPNSASIYFDFNAPVKTNTVHTRYCDQVNATFSSTGNNLIAQFTDQSTGTITGRLWDFGDGSTSTQTSPSHTYANPGTYTVCLITTGICRNDTTCSSITVCSGPPQSTYSAAPSGLSVAFTNSTTNAVTYQWDFGDGGTSTQASPSHTYTSNGTYTVCLISTSNCGVSDTLCNSVTVCVAPAAAFIAAPPSTGLVAFTDQSNSATSWQWTFGDGGTSTQQHPSHQYASDGNYTVCLIVSSGCASDTSCFNVAVCDVPVLPAFTSTPSGLSVSFSDLSSNAVSYAWDFGDGSTSTAQSPSHAYAQVGSYTVCLTITSACNRSATQCATVNVCVPPVATWTYTQPSPGTLVFTDGSQYATTWLWSFGNGATSGTQNPSHTYTQNATVTVCLTSSNSCGTDSTCLTIPVCPATLQAGFAVSPNQFTYTFTDQSFGANQWAWDFGDGGSSTAQSPSHTYVANGTYNVCLTASNECSTTSVICQPVTVQVVGVGNALPGFEISLRPNPMTDKAILYVGNPGVAGEYQLQIYDLRGAKVGELPGEFNQNLELQRNGLAAGLYTFRVMSEGVQIGFGRVVMD